MDVPEQINLADVFDAFHAAARRVGLTPEALIKDIETHKEETFRKLYPALCEEAK